MKSLLHPSSLTKSICTPLAYTTHYCMHILGRTARAGWSWPGCDLNLPCARLNREIPQSTNLPKKANWENRHISLMAHNLFYARFKFWVPIAFHVSWTILKQLVFTAISDIIGFIITSDKSRCFNHRDELDSAVQLQISQVVGWCAMYNVSYIIYTQDYVSHEVRPAILIRESSAQVFTGYRRKAGARRSQGSEYGGAWPCARSVWKIFTLAMPIN